MSSICTSVNEMRNSAALVEEVEDGDETVSDLTCNLSSASSCSTATRAVEYSCKQIELLLKRDRERYTIVENKKNRHSKCWDLFGFPAEVHTGDEQPRIIENFVTCRKCFSTYSFVSNSTRLMNSHDCDKTKRSRATYSSPVFSDSSASTQSSLLSFSTPSKIKINDVQLNKMKNLQARWICQDIRPFAILEDDGFRRIAQELILIGSKYGNVNTSQVLRSSKVISGHIVELARMTREKVRSKLIEPLENQSVVISPDLWSDPYRQIPYLGISASFVDAEFEYHAIDLCCYPFRELDKSSESIIAALRRSLISFGLDNLNSVAFVSDQGSNFVKALKPYSSFFCLAHKLNNVLKHSFYQNSSKTTKKIIDMSYELKDMDDDSDSEDEQGDEDLNTSPLMINENLPMDARRVLKTIIECKKLVKYVKKAGLNKEIQDAGGCALKQSTNVRWLSLIELLESIERSSVIIGQLLIGKKKFNIDMNIVRSLIRLLRPFKQIILIIQRGKEPSFHLVLISILTLRTAMESMSSLIAYEKSYKEDETSNIGIHVDNEYESEGMLFFRTRISKLLEAMIVLRNEHFAAAMLHPRYRHLKKCSSDEVKECKKYIQSQLSKIAYLRKNNYSASTNKSDYLEPPQKKQRKSFSEQFESGNVSDEYEEYDSEELNRYLSMHLDLNNIHTNPLVFWKENRYKFPLLSSLARQLHSVPATTAAVERIFSGGGLVINERRTNLGPSQLDNILFLRSALINDDLLQWE